MADDRASRLTWHLPLRLRLTIAFAGVMAAMLAAAGVFLYVQFRRDLLSTIDAGLRARTGDIVATAVDETDANQLLRESDERLAQVYAVGGRVLASSRGLRGTRLLAPDEARRAAAAPVTVPARALPGGSARVRAAAARTQDARRIVVAVGDPLAQADHELMRLRTLLFVAGPIALLLASFAGYEVAGSALRPVERMRARAADITEHDLGERLPVPNTGDEIERLGATLNDLLRRLEAAMARERRLVADASHELRTPLSVLRAEVDLALRGRRDAGELRAALASAGQEALRLSQLADDLLVLARLDQGRLPVRPEPIDAQDLLDAAAGRIRPAAGETGRDVSTRVEVDGGAVLLADPVRAAQAVDNLATNALRYGDGPIVLAARRNGATVELHVLDRGAGFPPEFLGRAFERFSRGDEARGDHGGSGLGLAIVDAIARAHGGRAGARNRPEGGADAWIALPAA